MLKTFTFPGLKSSRELLPFYAFAGCFVLRCTREPWALSSTKRWHLDCPYSSPINADALPIVVPGKNGYTFSPSEGVEELAMHLRKIAALTPADLGRMGEQSKLILRNFTPERFGNEIARIVNPSRRAVSVASASFVERDHLVPGSR